MEKAQIGLIGLAVMGANLARNIANNKFPIVVYNRTTDKMEEFIAAHGGEYLSGESELGDFVNKIEKPRKILVMVKAGPAVDAVIEQLIPLLDKGDMIIDCGNTHFPDTQRRHKQLGEQGFKFMGCGVSGGEEGALKGPSLMPGGDKEGYDEMHNILNAIAAKDFDGGACVTYVGDNGAGHYVKMVHNGIEYAVMQAMAEAYDMLRKVYGLAAPEISEIFGKFNEGKLNSYLFEISKEVLSKKDDDGEGYLVDSILDKAAQKGTGRWTAIDALNRGTGLSSIAEAVFARVASGDKSKRTELESIYGASSRPEPAVDKNEFVAILEDALYAAMLSCYAQGYDLIQKAAEEEKWEIDLAEVSRIWEGGCIIRAKILVELNEAYSSSDNRKAHLFSLQSIKEKMTSSVPALRKCVAFSAEQAVSSPALATALSYFDAMTQGQSPANFIQGLRDYFGAHTYERTDKEGSFHTQWI